MLQFTYGVNAWKHWVVQKNAELEKLRAQGKYMKTFETDILKLRWGCNDESKYILQVAWVIPLHSRNLWTNENILFQGGRAQLHAVHVREGGEKAEWRPLRAGLDILLDPGHPGMKSIVKFTWFK